MLRCSGKDKMMRDKIIPAHHFAFHHFVVRVLVVALACSLAGGCAVDRASKAGASVSNKADRVVLPESVPDPLEPVNRTVWAFNKAVLAGVVKPTAKVYRLVVVKPLRTGIGNFGRNITYPGRLINNLLQGKWGGARDETQRFFFNTVGGFGGFIDVAGQAKLPESDADFGETFGQWGWDPKCYLMLPIFGPSNERDVVGFAADTAANPLTYVVPYDFDPGNPLTYFSPYTYYHGAVIYNNLSDSVETAVRFTETEMDPYSVIQYAWTFVRKGQVADYRVQGEQDEASLETLQSVFFTVRDQRFPDHGRTREVRIPPTGKKLNFTYWLQKKPAPVVYIVPGLGSHRLAGPALALAELVYSNGFSAVTVSSAFNYEFMERASTAAVPSYAPMDAHDLHVALTEIDHRLEGLYPGRFTARALMGYSMGGFHSLFIAATNEASLIKFDRYVAINSPVRLMYAVSQLDEFFQAPLAWPSDERTENIENTFLKVAGLSKTSLTPHGSLPFSAIESRFLIGVAFRLILRDVIFSSQRRNNQGVLEQPINRLRREPVYREILQYSFKDYLDRFVTPYYQTRDIDLTAPQTLTGGEDLRTRTGALQANPKIRLIVNRNDILLADEDLAWLETAIGPERLTIFEKGGHLGNLAHPAVQKAIVRALEGLGEVIGNQ
jgi:ABC-type transporter lipoprotein component MlaA/pimeloyl-ACP methyl ester carboxylesterase